MPVGEYFPQSEPLFGVNYPPWRNPHANSGYNCNYLQGRPRSTVLCLPSVVCFVVVERKLDDA